MYKRFSIRGHVFFLPWILSNEEDGQICFALKPFQGNGAVYLENIQKLDRPASQALIRIMMTMMPRQLVNRRLLLLIMIRMIRMMMMPRQVEGSSQGGANFEDCGSSCKFISTPAGTHTFQWGGEQDDEDDEDGDGVCAF